MDTTSGAVGGGCPKSANCTLPKDNEPHVKTDAQGNTVKWCRKCCHWIKGANTHLTEEHQPKNLVSGPTPTPTPPAVAMTVPVLPAANLASAPSGQTFGLVSRYLACIGQLPHTSSVKKGEWKWCETCTLYTDCNCQNSVLHLCKCVEKTLPLKCVEEALQ